jgi:hypothetical protein
MQKGPFKTEVRNTFGSCAAAPDRRDGEGKCKHALEEGSSPATDFSRARDMLRHIGATLGVYNRAKLRRIS